MKGNDVIAALKRKFKVTTDRALGERLGITIQAIHNWKTRRSVTVLQIAGIVSSANRAGTATAQANAIRPIVEFFPIGRSLSKQKASYEVFGNEGIDGKRHPYLLGLRGELESHYGVYVFFDSRGRAIYTGKARRQSLWKEMKAAFNRERGEVQKIKRVSHPTRKVAYRTSDEKARQIRDHIVPLHELAAYFSAYEVADNMIGELEAMLVRSFANDLLNMRMERFGQQRRQSRTT